MNCHKKGNRITYKAGDKVPSDEDLVAKYPNKFELVSGQSSEGGVAVATAPDIPVPRKVKGKGKSSKSQSPDEMSKESEHGVDVTEDFPTAAKVELKVFEKSKWFTVIDPDNGEVLSEKKLRKDKVEDFLADYLQDDDEDDDEEGEDETTNDDEDEE